jgi:hypothetical protein
VKIHWVLRGLCCFVSLQNAYSETVAFPKIDLDRLYESAQSRKSVLREYSKKAWVITLHAEVIPANIDLVKSVIKDPKNRKPFYKVDSGNYWVNNFIPKIGKTSLTQEHLILSEKLLAEIPACNLKECHIKLHSSELTTLMSSKNKLSTYVTLIQKRASNFIKFKKFQGYDREDNSVIYLAALKSLGLKEVEDIKKILENGTLQYESLGMMRGTTARPIFKLYWASEVEAGPWTYLLQFDVYANHYFDSGMVAFILRPVDENHTFCLMYFNSEPDDLKKGVISRVLFGSKFSRLQKKVQKTYIKNIRILHNTNKLY